MLGFMLYCLGAWLISLWHFFASPGWPHKLLVIIEGVFICAGGVIVLFAHLPVLNWLIPPEQGNDNDYY